jgi:putative endonuclease
LRRWTVLLGSATGEDLTLRIAQHQAGTFEGYTALRRPVELVWSEYFDRITDAIASERQVKGWSRAKKEALIKGDWNSVRRRPNGAVADLVFNSAASTNLPPSP